MARVVGRRRSTWATRGVAALAALAALVGLTACTSSSHTAPRPTSTKTLPPLPQPTMTGPDASPGRPNIVYVLTDDLSTNLVQYMPHVKALMQAGMTFDNYTVTDSLCCPSRASIFTGRFPHDTHIIENTVPRGGFPSFFKRGEESSTFATSLHDRGYQTAFMGKYLNGYQPQARMGGQPGSYVPPGWSTWNSVGAGGYREYDYAMTDGHAEIDYGHKPQEYLGTVLDKRAVAYVHKAAKSPNPFMLEVATFAPHRYYVPAPEDLGTFRGLKLPRSPALNRLPTHPPAWMADRTKLTRKQLAISQRIWDLRVESVQQVDRMVGHLEEALQQTGQAKKTVFVFNSDNGFHLGEYTLAYGKQTAFDTDVHVPLIVSGPGIRPGSVNHDAVENIDIRPTFEQLAGAETPSEVDGHSFVPLLHGEPTEWRTVALIEHHHPPNTSTDPDFQNHYGGTPPSYVAIRTSDYLYVRYETGDREYYDLRRDPYELDNLGHLLSRARLDALDRLTNNLVHCHDGATCWHAALPTAG